MGPIDKPASSAPLVRPAGAADGVWISNLLRERWGAATVVVHGEVIDAAQLPALVAGPRRGLAMIEPGMSPMAYPFLPASAS